MFFFPSTLLLFVGSLSPVLVGLFLFLSYFIIFLWVPVCLLRRDIKGIDTDEWGDGEEHLGGFGGGEEKPNYEYIVWKKFQ